MTTLMLATRGECEVLVALDLDRRDSEERTTEHTLVSFEMIQQGPLISSQFKYILTV